MNLEGTKHEKAVLVVIAYIIGFTSGFIAFGISELNFKNLDDIATDLPVLDPATTPYVPPTSQPPAVIESAAASYSEGKLYADVGEERFVLSISNEVMPKDNVEGFATQGIHHNLPIFITSPSGRYVYFCEQQTTEQKCTSFIFDTYTNLIQFVSVAGDKLLIDNTVAKTAIFAGEALSLGEWVSASSNEPWKLKITE